MHISLVFTSLLFILCIFGANGKYRNAAQRNQMCPAECKIAYKCSSTLIEPVWTVVNGVCKGFINSCIFKNENCGRASNCEFPMKSVPSRNCKRKCAQKCEKQKISLLCAEFPNGRSMNFSNLCQLQKYSCKKSRVYTSYQNGVCPRKRAKKEQDSP